MLPALEPLRFGSETNAAPAKSPHTPLGVGYYLPKEEPYQAVSLIAATAATHVSAIVGYRLNTRCATTATATAGIEVFHLEDDREAGQHPTQVTDGP